ncbi:hypothetical protein G5I_02909 [Acromyrmex echinatior]|uniref:Uncharacterized protein n=1 Tax=Acromyrmex echinatior TaxID=103372 RepID=F4WBJ6_ACREC|nr:hypothetical protein G5I_02909 [Acromyrmex echinatior]
MAQGKIEGRFHQRRSSLIVINYQPQLVDSTKQQRRLVSQRPIKLTGIGETDPEYANFSKYISRFTVGSLCLLCDIKILESVTDFKRAFTIISTRRTENWNGRTGVATLRSEDGESPGQAPRDHETARKDPATSRISRARTYNTGMTRFPRLAPRSTTLAQFLFAEQYLNALRQCAQAECVALKKFALNAHYSVINKISNAVTFSKIVFGIGVMENLGDFLGKIRFIAIFTKRLARRFYEARKSINLIYNFPLRLDTVVIMRPY